MKKYETSDINSNPLLITNWYVDDYAQCKLAVENIAKNCGFVVVGSDDTYKELLVANSKIEFVIKITTINPRESGIDFCVTRKTFLINAVNIIDFWYSELKKQLQLKGKGLHKDGF